MAQQQISGGLVHDTPADLRQAIVADPKAVQAWESISEIARNEWICWVISVKQDKTRAHHVERVAAELAEGKRRPCCWIGCMHRTDKPVSPWVQKVLIDKQPQVK